MDVDDCNLLKSKPDWDSLKSQMINHLVGNGEIIFKSQQMGEPDLSSEEKSDIALNVLDSNPVIFLSRFGSYLLEEHLDYFSSVTGELKYEIDFYIKDIKKKLSSRRREVLVRNRRFQALKRLAAESDYFTEGEMKKRNPLMYHHLVGQYLTEDEKLDRESFANKSLSDENGYKLSSLLMEQWERDRADELKQRQQNDEEEIEEDSDESDIGEDDDGFVGHNKSFNLWGERLCKENKIKYFKKPMTEDEKNLLMEEFRSHAYASFLAGSDTDFNYMSVDNNIDYDDINEVNRDEEEKYFDSESPTDEINLAEDSKDGTMDCCVDTEMVSKLGVQSDSDLANADKIETKEDFKSQISSLNLSETKQTGICDPELENSFHKKNEEEPVQVAVVSKIDDTSIEEVGSPGESCQITCDSKSSDEEVDTLDKYMTLIKNECSEQEINSKMRDLVT